MNEKHTYVVRCVTKENYDTVTLSLTLSDGSIPPFFPGQFITVYFEELNTPEGKAYSISSAPHEQTLSVTVKNIGAFSQRLCSMKKGDLLCASYPYGFFYTEQESTELVLLAGGIGITPFRSILADMQFRFPTRRCSVLHSVRTERDALFRDYFTTQLHHSPRYFVTRDSDGTFTSQKRRLTAQDALAATNSEHTEYFLCGSISFVRDLWRDLTKSAVPEERIYTEAFFSH